MIKITRTDYQGNVSTEVVGVGSTLFIATETVQVMSDGTDGKVVDTYKDFGAKDSVMKMFENTGTSTCSTRQTRSMLRT